MLPETPEEFSRQVIKIVRDNLSDDALKLLAAAIRDRDFKIATTRNGGLE